MATTQLQQATALSAYGGHQDYCVKFLSTHSVIADIADNLSRSQAAAIAEDTMSLANNRDWCWSGESGAERCALVFEMT